MKIVYVRQFRDRLKVSSKPRAGYFPYVSEEDMKAVKLASQPERLKDLERQKSDLENQLKLANKAAEIASERATRAFEQMKLMDRSFSLIEAVVAYRR